MGNWFWRQCARAPELLNDPSRYTRPCSEVASAAAPGRVTVCCQTTLNKFRVHIPSDRFSQKTLCFENILTFFYQHVNSSLRAQLIHPPPPHRRFFYELLFIGSLGLNKSVFIWITGRSPLGFKKARRHGGVRVGVPDEDDASVAKTINKGCVYDESADP